MGCNPHLKLPSFRRLASERCETEQDVNRKKWINFLTRVEKRVSCESIIHRIISLCGTFVFIFSFIVVISEGSRQRRVVVVKSGWNIKTSIAVEMITPSGNRRDTFNNHSHSYSVVRAACTDRLPPPETVRIFKYFYSDDAIILNVPTRFIPKRYYTN